MACNYLVKTIKAVTGFFEKPLIDKSDCGEIHLRRHRYNIGYVAIYGARATDVRPARLFKQECAIFPVNWHLLRILNLLLARCEDVYGYDMTAFNWPIDLCLNNVSELHGLW